MKERPILFSAPMVRALLAGTKGQTRRALKGVDGWHPDARTVKVIGVGDDGCAAMPYDEFDRMLGGAIKCPYGQPGDRLWVREAWGYFGGDEYLYQKDIGSVGYRASAVEGLDHVPGGRWRPSIHMPRWASRITLEVTSVRVERLQDIREADAQAEGIERCEVVINGFDEGPRFRDYRINCDDPVEWFSSPTASYQTLWGQINGPGAWAANPWVWVVEFKRV